MRGVNAMNRAPARKDDACTSFGSCNSGSGAR